MIPRSKLAIGLIVFLSVAMVLVGAYVFHAVYLFYQYNRTSEQTVAENVQWTVVPLSDERYVLEGAYTYVLNGDHYKGSTLFSRTAYRNPYAAEEALKENQGKTWVVWYDPNDREFSTIDYHFPMKETIYASILFFLLYYFIWGGYFITRKMTKSPK